MTETLGYSCDFISGGSNIIAKAAVWIPIKGQAPDGDNAIENVVAYAMNQVIAIATVSSSSKSSSIPSHVLCTLRGHKCRINALDYMDRDNIIHLVSGSDDLTIKVFTSNKYRKGTEDEFTNWQELYNLSGFKESIVTISCLSFNDTSFLIAGSDGAGRIIIWNSSSSSSSSSSSTSNDAINLIEEILLPPAQMTNVIQLISLPTYKDGNSNAGSCCSNLIALILGSVDARVHIRVLTYSDGGNVFSTSTYIGALAGHEEWVTCLSSLTSSTENSLLIASGSQDSKIRLWRIAAAKSSKANSVVNVNDVEVNSNMIDDNIDDDEDDDENNRGTQLLSEEINTEARLIFDMLGTTYSVFFDALLVGHEDWITSVNWMKNMPSPSSSSSSSSSLLFSTSMDRNMVIWSQSDADGSWMPDVRFGDIGGQLGGSIGANLLGFTGGCVSHDGASILGIGYGGSFHLWRKEEVINTTYSRWSPYPYLTGHFGNVKDLSWASNGSYIISVSSDQTCRLFAETSTSKIGTTTTTTTTTSSSRGGYWTEVSRPQIHGYDLNCVALVKSPSLMIYTGGDEKLIRVFDAPLIVLEGLEKLCNIKYSPTTSSSSNSNNSSICSTTDRERIYRAYIPELGLSNRASDLMSKEEMVEQDARNVSTLDWSSLPLESQLADHTVWPEIRKLYSHTNDVMCITLSSNGLYLASACKARNSQTSGIIIWNTTTMLPIQTLLAHDSTVICLRFSSNDKYFATAGKDRSMCMFDTNNSSNDSSSVNQFTVNVAIRNAHKRIIWDMSWIDSSKVCSVSRDGTCKIWRVDVGILDCLHTFSPYGEVSVTSVDVCVYSSLSCYVAVGGENGNISVYDYLYNEVATDEKPPTLHTQVDAMHTHGSTVNRVRWQPLHSTTADAVTGYKLASCGQDNSVRLFTIHT